MESKKFNWNKILNGLIAGIGIILVCLFFGLCFVLPNTSYHAKALSKQDILNEGIYFNSAKTKVRNASSYNITRLYDKYKLPFNAYTYRYNDSSTTDLFNEINEYTSENGKVSLSTSSGTLSTFEKIPSINRYKDFIPYDADYFLNTQNQMERIFYDEIDNGDFVILDGNYNVNVTDGSNFNVENFYLSFGDQFIEGNVNSTLLYNLQVTGTLYNATGKHNIILNSVDNTTINSEQNALSWYQYFDLRELYGYSTGEGLEAYAIEDLQGRYDISFKFIKYTYNAEDNKYSVSNDTAETFTYTFYLLDSANYSNIPNINNATLGSMSNGQINEYFYNYTSDSPYLEYNPSNFNISYSRENREINDIVTSSYLSSTYSDGQGNNLPLGIINFYLNKSLKKQVFILTYYNSSRTKVEYLYLANNSSTALNFVTYSAIKDAVDKNQLDFEYKTTQTLNIITNINTITYNINSYKTYDFDKRELSIDDSWDITDDDKITSESKTYNVTSTISGDYTIKTYSQIIGEGATTIAETKELQPREFSATTIESGVILNKEDLTDDVDNTLDFNSTKYILKINETDSNSMILEKYSYTGTSTDTQANIILDKTKSGTFEINDPIDRSISIKYIVDTNKIITNVSFVKNILNTNSLSGDATTLDYILNIDKLPTDQICYNIEFDELGIYNFEYNYNIVSYDHTTSTKQAITNNTTNSTNILAIRDYSKIKQLNPTTISTSTNDTVYLNIQGYLDIDNKVTLAGIPYIFNEQSDSLTINSTTIINMSTQDNRSWNTSIPVSGIIGTKSTITNINYYINTDINGNKYLKVAYEVGHRTLANAIVSNSSTLQNFTDYIISESILTYNSYIATIESSNIADNTSEEWSNILAILECLEVQNIDTYNSVIITHLVSTPNVSSDKLHILGSKTYFNKTDNSTDSGYAKFELFDNRTKDNYTADVTKFIGNLVGTLNDAIKPTSTRLIKDIDASNDTFANATKYLKGFTGALIEQNQIKASDIIITDVTPVLWKNYSSLLYDGKISKSIIYRYPNYQLDTKLNTLSYGSECITSIYTKDTYCQFDGLYEIVVFYKYDALKSMISTENYNDTIFYQVFTFIIDNSSPKLNIKIQGTDGNYTENLGLNKYTNKNIELSWEIPSYFRNNVYIEIQNDAYTGSESESFVATYNAGNITTISGNQTYINTITNTNTFTDINNNKYYAVYIKSDNSPCNGNYKVILHYSTKGNSTVTEEFVIDKQNIAGLKTIPIIQNDDGTYSAGNGESSQILNYDFTFRYNKKNSGANIFTYWHKIELSKSEFGEYDKLINIDDATGITTTFKLNVNNASDFNSGNQYNYNYDTSNIIPNNNCFVNTNSAIYLFRLKDEAGNECRYVVFYDTTTPRFQVVPEVNNDYNVINETTQVNFGDYKAILLDDSLTPSFSIDLNKTLNDYNFDSASISGLNKFEEALIYLNSNSKNKFKDTRIRLIDGKYYLLLPISNIQIQDISSIDSTNYSTTIQFDKSQSPNVDSYYFFPKNPITDDGLFITLPKYFFDSSITDTNITKNSPITGINYQQVLNSYNQPYNRFFSTTGDTQINGAFGQGEFEFKVLDNLGNIISGYLWMNLDKTQVMAQGIFDKSIDDVSKSISLTGEQGSYSASKMFISSLEAKDDGTIPNYELTYKFFEFNNSLYNTLQKDYKIHSIELINKDNATSYDLLFTDQRIIMRINYSLKSDTSSNPEIKKHYDIEIKNELGEDAPQHSYPYDLEGLAVVADSSGEPEHIYNRNKNSYKETGADTTRIFSTILNPTADANGEGNIVTQEGLYIFTRKYTQALSQEDLGEDSMLIYRIYYVDRTGIINVTTTDGLATALTDRANSQIFGYTLGSNYSEAEIKNQKHITAQNIQNSQISVTQSGNAYDTALELFSTNKVQVQYNLTADKYNFQSFTNSFYNDLQNYLTNSTNISNQNKINIQNGLDNYLFSDWYQNKFYKTHLTLSIGANNKIIDESSENANNIYNVENINTYLKNYIISDQRHNTFNFYLQDSNSSNAYKIVLKDSSGYRKTDGAITLDNNYLSNELDMSFKINHTAPTGETYGKYYGRHDYDESATSGHSIPIETIIENGKSDTVYALLSKYLKEGQLESLSLDIKSESNSINGKYVKLFSTNNESLIFTFSITQDDYMAQIDPNNIQIYKGSINDNSLIFNRKNGTNIASPSQGITAERMNSSFIKNTIDGVTYYAIIVFDNNLDQILNENEIAEYSQYRLLDANQNVDKETYFIKLNYIGDASNYIKEDNMGNQESYASTTYEITIDRDKPVYNLAKLMELDKYVYSNVTEKLTSTNYENVFENYKQYYNFAIDTEDENEKYDFERSYLENYFFAVDYRPDTTFEFESISELDSTNGIYIRNIDKNSYKFSITPDDYKAYYEATYLPGHPQFTPSRAQTVSSIDINEIVFSDHKETYYFVPFNIADNSNNLQMSYLVENGCIIPDNYYEIIESDEAGNYRVYAIYVPDYKSNQVSYKYKTNSISNESIGTISYSTNINPKPSGMNFEITKFKTKDMHMKATITIKSEKLNEVISIIYVPKDECIYIRNSKNLNIDVIKNIPVLTYTETEVIDGNGTGTNQVVSYINSTEFIKAINKCINDYNDKLSNKDNTYYTQYGYTLEIAIIDRIGIVNSIDTSKLNDFEITYTVAGSILSPLFENNSSYFTMTIPALTGTTYITNIEAYIFKGDWSKKPYDDNANSFAKDNDLIKGFKYTLGKGVYKFELTDNFKRTNSYFYEFGSSTTQAGGTLRYKDTYKKYTDGYTYTAKNAEFVYDNTIYDIYIKFEGEDAEGNEFSESTDVSQSIIYSSKTNSDVELRKYGISVATLDNWTTITLMGVKDLNKYHIKTIPASISTKYNYTWDKENSTDENASNILAYDKKVAIYTAIPHIVVKNLNGNTLSTTNGETLNLTEDFEVTLGWSGIDIKNQINFDNKIVLTRTYTENNVIMPSEVINNASSYIITKPGTYTAYVINSLNQMSPSLTFTRGEGEISMYSVVNINKTINNEVKLNPSSLVSSEEYSDDGVNNRNIIKFNYFTTTDYFSFKNTETNTIITLNDLFDSGVELDVTTIGINKNTKKYLDVRVNSNLSIETSLYAIGIENQPFVEFRVYSSNSSNETYTYRFIRIYFLSTTIYSIVDTEVFANNNNEAIYSTTSATSVIKRPDTILNVNFKKSDTNSSLGLGNTIYIDRYFNNNLIETLTFSDEDDFTIRTYLFTLSQVGLYKFAIRDLAGRYQVFGTDTNTSKTLSIYLINQIIFTVNDHTPINNQIFNDTVKIDIVSIFNGLKLYDTNNLGITISKNGIESTSNSSNLQFSDAGYYSVKIIATTMLSDENDDFTDQEISTVYNFVIVKTNIALKSFNVSKGTGFVIEKIFKIVGGEREEITDKYESQDSLIWLTHEKEGNSVFEITLKSYNSNIQDYQDFTFKVWINQDTPIILSTINEGTTTKETIVLSFNPGIIYTQVGNCKILVNDTVYMDIDENSERVVNEIKITQKGTYIVQIVSEDGTLISSYKYTKAEPFNKTTQIILICVACGVALLTALFFIIRRKGKYR